MMIDTHSIHVMDQAHELALQQHRVYLLRTFEHRDSGDIFCSGFAPSNPENVINVRFPNAQIVSSWQDRTDVMKLEWPLEIISFKANRLQGARFRFTLTCLDFERVWDSDWPRLV
jgi:hypothetical protein